jgi:hypothetical protein
MSEKKCRQYLNTILKKTDNEPTEPLSLTQIRLGAPQNIEEAILARVLCEEINRGVFSFVTKKREREEIYITKNEMVSVPNITTEELMFQFVEIYSRIALPPSVESFYDVFRKVTGKKIAVLSFLSKHNADFLEVKVLIRYITAFLSGEIQLSVQDLGLSYTEVLDLHERIGQQRLILQSQYLIDFVKERNGIYMSNLITSRLTSLLKNDNIHSIPRQVRVNYGFYQELKYTDIKPCKLQYNVGEQKLLNELTKLKKNSPDIGFTLLLHGSPGTGKTEFAYQLARLTKSDLYQLNFAEIQSKWIGETEKNLRIVFDQYERIRAESDRTPVLLMNEADGLMNCRVHVSVSNDVFHNQTQTQLLELLENFSGVLVATTNLYKNIDDAFYRRFLFRQEITLPCREIRQKLLQESELKILLPSRILAELVDCEWSPAQLRNIESKIHTLKLMSNTNPVVIENLLTQEGMMKTQTAIGFLKKNQKNVTNNNSSPLSY